MLTRCSFGFVLMHPNTAHCRLSYFKEVDRIQLPRSARTRQDKNGCARMIYAQLSTIDGYVERHAVRVGDRPVSRPFALC